MTYHSLSSPDAVLKNFSSKLAVGRMAYETGYFSQALRHFQSAMDLAAEEGLADDLLAVALLGAAKSTAALGNFDAAKKFLEKAVRIHEADIETAIECAEDYHQLSLVYWRSGKVDLAFQTAQKSWEIANKDKNTPDELKAKLLKHFAILSEQTGKFDECERYLNQALDFIEQSSQLGKYSSIYGDVLLVKVLLLGEQKRFDEAKELYPHALQIVESTRGIAHPRVKEVIQLFEEIANNIRSGNSISVQSAIEDAQKKSKHGII